MEPATIPSVTLADGAVGDDIVTRETMTESGRCPTALPIAQHRISRSTIGAAWCAIATLAASAARADDVASATAVDRQSLDDAWWTGPILAANASTLPEGHVLIEPYVYDVMRRSRFDADGERDSTAHSQYFGSLTYINYGVTDTFTAGLIPTFGFNDVSAGRDSSGIGLGDLTVQGQYRLTQFREEARVPTISLVLQETLPTGKYDRLGDRPSDGLGSGAYTTTVALYSQYYSWLPNGRILRTRFNVSYSLSDDVSLTGVSVYGTPEGFRGDASPGDSLTVNAAWEYSVTRNWVLALDVVYQHFDSTRVMGQVSDAGGASQPFDQTFASGWQLGLAPAIEYNWSSRVGVIFGTRWFAAGRNADASLTPVVAINMVY